jgi:hypothetical protein
MIALPKAFPGILVATLSSSLLLLTMAPPVEARDLVPIGARANWKYLEAGVPPAGWNQAGFDDSRWKSGKAPLGYGESRVSSTLTVAAPVSKPITVWFRHEFAPLALKPTDPLVLLLCVDDGAVAYLNGHEIGRLNLPDGTVDPTTTAVRDMASKDEGFYARLPVPPGAVKPGRKNVLAIEVHQASAESDDLFLDAALKTLPAAMESFKAEPAAREVMDTFHQEHFIGPTMGIPNGYFDGGRHMVVSSSGSVASPREILLVDRARDTALEPHRALARSSQMRALPTLERVQRLAAHVDRVTTPPGGDRWVGPTIDQITREFTNKPLLLGDVIDQSQAGVCRHRALLFKILADEAGIRTALVRGNFARSGTNGFPHAWNEVTLENGRRVLVDVMHHGGKAVFPELTAKYVVEHYLRENNTPWYPPARPGAR